MKEEFTTMNIPNGRFFGYPECCVQEFGDKAKLFVFKPEVVKKQAFNGFIPCEKCATELASGKITRKELISKINEKRECSIPFKEQHTLKEDEIIKEEIWWLMASI